MFRKPLLLLVPFLFTLASFAQQAWVPGEVLILLKKGTTISGVQQELFRELPVGAKLKAAEPLGRAARYQKLVLEQTGLDDRELAKRIARLPGVEATSLNYLVKPLATPNDAMYGQQWGLQDANIDDVWDHTIGGTMANGMRIGVALSDLAIQTGHPDLSGNIWPDSPSQGGGEDHGTEVASVLGAVGNNNIGIAGVNWDVEIFSSGETDDLSDVIEQFEAATFVREQFNASNGANGLMVVSITASWGVPDAACNGFMTPMFTDMTAAGIILVASGPNETQDMDVEFDFPSNCALGQHLVVTSYGPQNQVPFATGSNSVHLLAPGIDIPVATAGSTYAVADGNSFAIPHVAGAVALLYSIPCPSFAQLVMNDPVAARELVKNAILNNTTPFPGGSAITITGGKLNVFAAYQALMANCTPTCTDYTISLTTIGDPVTTYTVMDWRLDEVAVGGGNTIQACLDDGCYTINLNGTDGLPMEADFVVEDGNGIVATGNSVGGIISLSLGDVVSGCTISGSNNFNPQANCNDGTCCLGEMVSVLVASDDFETEGTANVTITSNGAVLFSGTMNIAMNNEFGAAVAVWEDCVPDGCLTVEVTGSSVPLYGDGFVFSDGDFENALLFDVVTGFFGPIGGGGTETCDGQDNDCDGETDEGFIWYVDADNDGWGAIGSGATMCSPSPTGFTQQEGDCDDANNLVFPGAEDACATADGLDNDCDGSVDEDGLQSWYEDLDGDGYGTTETIACTAPPNHSNLPFDCDDTNPAIHPDHEEVCDGVDNDCDLTVDEGFYWVPDADNDGWGSLTASSVYACVQPIGHVQQVGDCDDADANIFPGAFEACDGLDNDCNGTVDDSYYWYVDADGDGYGDENTRQVSCTPLPGGSQLGGDCDDTNPSLTAMFTPCNDGDPSTINDVMNGACLCIGTPNSNCPPGEIEDCNGNCAPIEWIGDGTCDDGSFEWEGNAIFFNCAEFGFDGGDCANCVSEVCDGMDNDCDGQVDENFIWYVDADGDGYGDPATEAVICSDPGIGFTQAGDDCDDTNVAIHPGATEVCDGLDNNCDGITDGTTVDFQVGCTDPMACNYDPGAVCGGGTCQQGSIADGTETFATDFTATDVNGNTVNLFALLAQGKSVIIDFFTTWCPPSIAMNSAGFLQDWYAHMGPDGLDHIRMVSIEIEDTATVTGSLTPFLADATWPFIATGSTIAQQYNALGLYNSEVPTLVMICPDRTAQRIYPFPDALPYSGLFNYEPAAALELLNEKCGCRGTPCLTNVGCMDANACNYDPSATCPGPCAQAQEWFADADGDGYGGVSLGIACAQPANSTGLGGDCDDNNPDVQVGFDLYVLTEDESLAGSAHYVISQGSTLIEGDLQLPEETQGVGMLPVCIGTGCFSIQITPNDVPLWEESYITPPNDQENFTSFSTIDGFFGSLSGPAEEVCNGIDDDCDGEVDEGFPQEYADNDGDGFGNPLQPLPCDTPGVANNLDCDDSDPAINPDQGCSSCSAADRAWIVQNQSTIDEIVGTNLNACVGSGNFVACLTDLLVQETPLPEACATCIAQRYACILNTCLVPCLNGFETPSCQSCVQSNCNAAYFACVGFTDADADGVVAELDCDDSNAAIYPGATEVCDGIDNDCDGSTDEGIVITYYTDSDFDGYGDDATALTGDCDPPPGMVPDGGDCDDTDNTVFPGAPELCDNLDNNCDGAVDNNAGIAYYTDADNDTFGNDASETFSCTPIPGMITQGGDCDDFNAAIHPGATDPCDGLDQDCSGGPFLTVWYQDNDGDTYGNDAVFTQDCTQPPGFVVTGGDCDDANASVFPGNGCGNCSTTDQQWLTTHQQLLINTMGFCVGQCFNDPDCIMLCMQEQGIPISAICLSCIPEHVTCLFDNCTVPCLNSQADCIECQVQAGCMAQLSNCMGMPDGDGDGWWTGSDCNDANAAIYPGALELCDGLDNNCDGSIDEGLSFTYYTDEDGDGFGLDGTGVQGDCEQPPGTALQAGDCDDADGTVFPGAPELCDNVDNNCDGAIDNEAGELYYADADDDGYGDETTASYSCTPLQDMVTLGGDCNDTDASIHPGAADPCDSIDQDCSGGPVLTTWYQDLDSDNFGNNNVTLQDCTQPTGYVLQFGDCDDNDPGLFPGNGCGNCLPTEQQWIATHQLELIGAMNACFLECLFVGPGCIPACMQGAGVPAGAVCLSCVDEYMTCWQNECLSACLTSEEACMECQLQSGCFAQFATCLGQVDADGDGWWAGSDCDDTNANVHPDAVEGCAADGLDNDCDGQVDEDALTDADGDGYSMCDGDCNDTDENVNPGLVEVCDGLDNNCDGVTDEGFTLYWRDFDGDGFGDPQVPQECNPVGGVTNQLDCDDNDPTIYAGAPELCDGIDNNCDGQVDEGVDVDDDADGATICAGDCDDTNAGVHPGATELCDGIDNDCNGQVDEGCTVMLSARVFLEGPYNPGTGLMNDGMRTLGLVPTTEPYTGLGYTHVGGGGETTTPAVLALSGDDAVVDWVLLELRDAVDPSIIVASRSVLVQRDGDVVDTDGTSAVSLPIGQGNYHVAVRHRSHLGAMTASTQFLFAGGTIVDLTLPSTATFGTEACRVNGALQLLWCGDVTFDGVVRYTGSNNDRDPILTAIGSVVPTNVVSGSGQEDVNMDGVFKYVGQDNDRDPILQTIGGTVPTAIRVQQLP